VCGDEEDLMRLHTSYYPLYEVKRGVQQHNDVATAAAVAHRGAAELNQSFGEQQAGQVSKVAENMCIAQWLLPDSRLFTANLHECKAVRQLQSLHAESPTGCTAEAR
jgi:hypothetical protein